MTYECPYCNWTMRQPSQNEYPDTPEGQREYEMDLHLFYWEQENHSYTCHNKDRR